MDAIPPTYAALVEHTKRVAYQAGYCWAQALTAKPNLPPPDEWGWKKSETLNWEPVWTILPEASKAIRELIKCGCQVDKGCRGNCKCVKANLECTALCNCGGGGVCN